MAARISTGSRRRDGEAVPAGGDRVLAGLSRLGDLLLLALAAVYLVILARQAAHAVFRTDECFHAYLAEWIAGHGRLPRDLPELYSGLPYFYPPLFHIVGAGAYALCGAGCLPFLNLALTIVLFAFLYAWALPEVPAAPRRWALLLCMANASLSQHVVRNYAETLATLLTVVVVVLLLRLRARERIADGVRLGVVTGLAVLAKQPAVLYPLLLAVLAGIVWLRGRHRLATVLLVAVGVAIAISLPYFARNAIDFGSPFYPPVTGDAGRALDAMNTRMFSLPPFKFYVSAGRALGPVIPWIALAALAWHLSRGRCDLRTGVILLCTGLVAAGPFIPRFEARHLNPYTASLALAPCLVLHEALVRPRWARVAAQFALLALSALFVARMPNYRHGLDPPPWALEAYRAVAEKVPAGRTVLSALTYDTFYYARRTATWPVPWGPSAAQLALFTEPDPARFQAALDRLGIDYILLPRMRPPAAFDGENYPESFVRCAGVLMESGRLRPVWMNPSLALIERVR